MLEQIDPESASEIHPNQTVRIIRALEIFALTGKKKSQLSRSVQDSKYEYFVLYDLENRTLEKVNTLEEAALKAKEVSKKGDVVLFSPASASFDMFKNFEERGNKFKELVLNL